MVYPSASGAPHVLLVDPDAAGAERIAGVIRRTDPTLRHSRASHLAAAAARLRAGDVACVLTTLPLPDAASPDVLRTLRAADPRVPIVVCTAAGSEELAVLALRLGAADYLRHDDAGLAHLAVTLQRLLGRSLLALADAALPSPAIAGAVGHQGLVAGSAAMRAVVGLVDRAAQSGVPVLLEGETGTGKELLARAIHERGPRRAAPFLAQNCAAIPEALLESELFGHMRGAFTGAERDRRGLFVEAGAGTVFLDEIGEGPPAVQARLLRVLQQGEVKAVGADRPVPVRARVVAATNRALDAEVAAGRFRADLYWRLAVFPIRVPPLRARPAEVTALAETFRRRFEREEARSTGGFTPAALVALAAHGWPGNVRELEHEIHRLVLTVATGRPIRPQDLAPRIRAAGPPHFEPLARLLARVELAVLHDRVEHLGSKTAAARSLGISREALYAKLRRLARTIS